MPRGVSLYDEARVQGRLWTPVGRSNIILSSEGLVSPWVVYRATATANAGIAPDGMPTATLLASTAVSGTHGSYQIITVPSGTAYVFSCCFKASPTATWSILQTQATGAYRRAWFDLANGVVGTVESGLTGTILGLGRGWYRCQIAFTGGGTSNEYYVQPATANGVETFTTVNGVYVWGMHLQAGTANNGYIRTGSSSATDVAGLADPVKAEGWLAWRCSPNGGNGLAAAHPFKNRPPLIGG